MPIYQIEGLDGKVYRIEGPDGLAREQVMAEVLRRAPQAGRAPAPKPEGFFANVGQLIKESVPAAVEAYKLGPSVLAGSVPVEKAGAISKQLSAERTTPPELQAAQEAFKDEAAAFEKAKGFVESVGPVGQMVLELGRQVLTNPKGAVYLTAQSAAQTVPVITAMLAGGAAGSPLGPVGSAAGAVTGAFGAGAIGESGAEFISGVQRALQADGLPPTEANVAKIISDIPRMQKIAEQARAKGATTAAVEAAFTGGSGRVITAPARNAIRLAQRELGEAATEAQVKARAADILSQRTLGQKVGRGTAAGAIDVVGGGVAEAAGQQAGYGKVDLTEVGLETLGGLGSSVVEVPAAAISMGRERLPTAQPAPATPQAPTAEAPAAAEPAEALEADTAPWTPDRIQRANAMIDQMVKRGEVTAEAGAEMKAASEALQRREMARETAAAAQAQEVAPGAQLDLFGAAPTAPEPEAAPAVEEPQLRVQDPRQMDLLEPLRAPATPEGAIAQAQPDLFGMVYPPAPEPQAEVEPQTPPRPDLRADALQMPLDLRARRERRVTVPEPQGAQDVAAIEQPAAEPAGGGIRPEQPADTGTAEPGVVAPVELAGQPDVPDTAGAVAPERAGVAPVPRDVGGYAEPAGPDATAVTPEAPIEEAPAAQPSRPSAFTIPSKSQLLMEQEAAAGGGRRVRGTRYRTPEAQPAPAQPIQDAELRRVVASVQKALDLPDLGVNILDSVQQFDPRQEAGRRAGALGDNGQIYLFRDGIPGGVEGQKTIFHELLHRGLRNLLPQGEYFRTLHRLYLQSAQVRSLADAWLDDAGNMADVRKLTEDPVAQKAIAVDEVLAAMAEQRKLPGTVRQIGNWLANLAARLGMPALARSIRTMGMKPLEAFIDDALRAAGTAPSVSQQRYATQRAQTLTDTPAFKRWFGDSKVVDANGEPLVVYHGTTRGIPNVIGTPYFYMTESRAEAKAYAGEDVNPRTGEKRSDRKSPTGEVGEFYVSLQNPVVLPRHQRYFLRDVNYLEDQIAEWKAQGYDGVIMPWEGGEKDGVRNFIAFRPEQIKSAVGNIGAFDPTSPDIRYRTAKPPKAEQVRDAQRKAAVVSDVDRRLAALDRAPVTEPTRMQQATAALRDAKENPRLTAKNLREAGRTWMDSLQVAAADANAAIYNDAYRLAQDDLRAGGDRAQQAMGILTKVESARGNFQTMAGLVIQNGNAELDPETGFFKAKNTRTVRDPETGEAREEKVATFQDLAGIVQSLQTNHGLSAEQADRVYHTYMEARRVEETRDRNDALELQALMMDAKGDQDKASDFRRLKVVGLPDAAWVAEAMKFGEQFPELQQAVDTWMDIRENTLNIAVSSGLVSRAQAEAWLDAAGWVPFYREGQVEANKGPKEFISGLQVKVNRARLKGSAREVADIFTNQIQWAQHLVEQSLRNQTGLDRMDVLVQFGMAKQWYPPNKKPQLGPGEFQPSFDTPDNVIRLMRNGLPEYYAVDSKLHAKSFEALQAIPLDSLKGLAKVTDVFRKMITLFPLFGILQVPQDAFAAMYTSGLSPRYALTLPARAVKEFLQVLVAPKTSKAFQELRQYGAVGSYDVTAEVVKQDLELIEGARKAVGLPAAVWRSVSKSLHHISMASDAAVRQAVYNAAISQGLTKQEALTKAFNLINFRNQGSSGGLAKAAQYIPFLRAFIAAQNVAYKTLSGQGTSPTARKNALMTLASTTFMVSALSMLYAMAVGGDEEYEKKPRYQADRGYYVPGLDIFIPMRQDIFALPKILSEHLWHHITDSGTVDGANTRRAVKDLMASSFMISVIPQPVRPILEVWANYNPFLQRPIVSAGDQMRERSVQYSESTSELGKLVGRADLASPFIFDHLFKGYLGMTGGAILMATNDLIAAFAGVPRPEMSMRDMAASIPGLGVVFGREGVTKQVQDMYELREAVTKVSNTVATLRDRDPEALARYAEQENVAERFALAPYVNSYYRKYLEIRKARAAVLAAPESEMDAATKREYLDYYDAQAQALLESMNLPELRKMANL